MKESIVKNVEKLAKVGTSEKRLISAFTIFKPTKRNWKKYLYILFLCGIPTYLISTSLETVSLFGEALDIIMDVILALFGIIFTGYAFFQALVNDELLLNMLEESNIKKKKSKLQETNEFFVELMMLYVVSIMSLVVLRITISAIPDEFVLCNNSLWNNFIAAFLIELYFVFNAFILWETKSFIFNVFQLFNAHTVARVIELYRGKE